MNTERADRNIFVLGSSLGDQSIYRTISKNADTYLKARFYEEGPILGNSHNKLFKTRGLLKPERLNLIEYLPVDVIELWVFMGFH
jgi:hypothetical protein